MAMTALDTCKVVLWLESVKPGATLNDLKQQIEIHFGEIKWGWCHRFGEGLITAQIGDIKGCSGGLCTSEEALMELVIKLLNHEEAKKIDESVCDWL